MFPLPGRTVVRGAPHAGHAAAEKAGLDRRRARSALPKQPLLGPGVNSVLVQVRGERLSKRLAGRLLRAFRYGRRSASFSPAFSVTSISP